MGTFDFRVKKLNSYGYRLIAAARAANITANGVSTNAVSGRILNEDPTTSIGSVTVHWKKARNRIELFSGREESSGTISTDSDGFFTLSPIVSDTEPGPWLMSFEALAEGVLVGDVVFWYEEYDIAKGVENLAGVPPQNVDIETARYDYSDTVNETYEYDESATPSVSNPHPWLPPPWYAVNPDVQNQLNSDFNIGGYIGDREFRTAGIVTRGEGIYSPQFVEPINGDLYDTSANGNNLSTGASPELHNFEAMEYVRFPGTSGNHLIISQPQSSRSGETIYKITFKTPDYTPVSNKVIFDDHDGSSGMKVTILTSGILEIDLESSTYQTVNPNLLDGNQYTFEFETDFIDQQLIVNIYDDSYNLVFRELITITETSLSFGGDIYVGVNRSNANQLEMDFYDFYLQDESGVLSSFDASASNFANGVSSAVGNDDQGNVITIARSASGYKTTIVDRPLSSSKSDTYFTSSSSALNLDNSSFTIVLVLNYWDAASSTEPLIMKKATVSTVGDAGYALYLSSSNSVFFRVSDGSTQNSRSIASNEGGGLHYLAVVADKNSSTIKLTDGTNTDSAAWNMNSVSTVTDFVLLNDTGFSNGFQGNMVGAGLFKEALTDAEILDAAQKLGLD